MTRAPRRRFQPRFWPTAASLLVMAGLLGLGTWQLQRLEWKEALIAKLEVQAAAAPIDLPRDTSSPDLDFAPVRLRGRFLHDKELYVPARTHKGQAGLHIVTPLRLDDGRGVLVDRGWVPPDKKDPAMRAPGQIEGIAEVSGIVRRGGWHGSSTFQPANQPEDNLWLWMDLPAMAARAGLSHAETQVYVRAGTAANPGGFPIGAAAERQIANNHLVYAITWYSLAVALLVIYFVHQSRPVKDET